MGAACVAAGMLGFVRLLRWRLWSCEHRPDLLCLGTGYAWLGIGLLAIGLSVLAGHRTAALHVVTVGALGTLTFNVMGMTALARARRVAAHEPIPVWGTVLIGGATLLRVSEGVLPETHLALLIAAAGCWSLAFLMLCALFAYPRAERYEASQPSPGNSDSIRHGGQQGGMDAQSSTPRSNAAR